MLTTTRSDGKVEVLRRGVDDAAIRLMRNQPRDVARRHARALERDVRRLDHLGHGEAEHFAAVHHDFVALRLDVLGAHRRRGGPADFDVEILRFGSVRAEFRAEERVDNARLEHDRARTVTEKHRGGAVLVIHDARKLFGADEQHALEYAGAHHARSDGQPVDEAAARDLDVERGDARDAELRAENARGRRKDVVRRDGRDDDAVEVLRFEARRCERVARRVHGDLARRLVGGGDVPLLHPGARGDPLVRRVEHALEVGVGEDPLGHVVPDARDADPCRRHLHRVDRSESTSRDDDRRDRL